MLPPTSNGVRASYITLWSASVKRFNPIPSTAASGPAAQYRTNVTSAQVQHAFRWPPSPLLHGQIDGPTVGGTLRVYHLNFIRRHNAPTTRVSICGCVQHVSDVRLADAAPAQKRSRASHPSEEFTITRPTLRQNYSVTGNFVRAKGSAFTISCPQLPVGSGQTVSSTVDSAARHADDLHVAGAARAPLCSWRVAHAFTFFTRDA